MAKKKKHIRIPRDLAARVIFASNRTCCVCRNTDRPVQIHHIDATPSNNSFANLAVMCKYCHDEAHETRPFSRNLTPELVDMFNSTWRSQVASKMNPDSDRERLAFRATALGDLASTVGSFKTKLHLLAYQHGHEWVDNPATTMGERYREELAVEYSRENWERYRKLFETDLPAFVDRLERLLLLYADVIPTGIKSEVLTLSRVAPSERGQYLQIPLLKGPRLTPKDLQSVFRVRFIGLMGTIKHMEEAFRTAYDGVSEQLKDVPERQEPQ